MLHARALRQCKLVGNADNARVSAHGVDLVSLTDPTSAVVRVCCMPDKNNEAGEKSRSLTLTLHAEPGNFNGDKNIQDLQSRNARRMDAVETGFLRDMRWCVHCDCKFISHTLGWLVITSSLCLFSQQASCTQKPWTICATATMASITNPPPTRMGDFELPPTEAEAAQSYEEVTWGATPEEIDQETIEKRQKKVTCEIASALAFNWS
jgi:hypothetical protein